MATIEGFRMQNFRTLHDVSLDKLSRQREGEPLKPFTVVIGKNGAGKSSLFDALGRWQMKRAGTAPVGYVGVDPGTPVGTPRLLSFVKSVSLAAAYPGAGGQPPGSGGGQGISMGTGIVVDTQGHVLTSNHVIARCAGPQVTDSFGGAADATILARDESNDLALLRTDRHWPASARFRDSRGLRPGESLVVTGYPLSGLVSPEMAVTTGSLTALAGIRGDSRQIQFSAPIQPGNSGGPVLDESGRVVAIASSMLNGLVLAAATGALPQNVNFAIKTDIAEEFLAANQVAVDSAPTRPLGNAASVADLARKFTVKNLHALESKNFTLFWISIN